MASVARIADIRGLVSLNDGEEILKERDPISENGGILTISEFARIIFDDGREIEVQGPVQLTLNENFFQTGEFDIQNVQIENLNLVRDTVENLVTNIEGGTLPENPSEAFVATEQLDTLLENDEVISSTRSVGDDLAPTEAPTEPTPTEPTPTEPTPTEPTPTEPTPTEPTPTEPTPTEPTPTEPTPTEPTPTEPTPTEPTPTEPTPTEPTPTIPVDTRVPASVITLSDSTVDEGKQITITATVTNPPQTDLIITLDNGQTITISAGQTTGSTTFTNPNSEDVYIDNSTETYTIVGTDGGNYKDLVTTDTATVTINDTIQDTTVTLNDVTVDEGTGTAKITATIDNAPTKEPLVLTLSNGATVTFAVGATTAESTPFNIQGDDAYNDGENYSVKVDSYTGGSEFENLVTTDTATVTINDTIQDTTVTLNDVTVDEGTGTAKITATIDNAPTKEPLVLTLSNGATVTFAVGATTAESTPFNIQGDDVYKDGESYSVKVDSYTGGSEFENLVTTDTATVTINDTIQDTTVTLNDVTVDEGTGTAKITATIDNAPTKEPLVLTLSNGATITFEVGQTTAESTPFNIQGDDVYKDGESYSVKVDSYTGGSEFENLVTTDTATVTINDTENEVKVNVTAENSIDAKNITLNVSLTNKDGLDTKVTNTPLEVVLNDGTKITIPVGETEGSITVPNPIKTGGEFTYTVDLNKTTGGNYEKLEGSSTTITTKDIVPPTITITGSTVTEANTGEVTGNKVVGTVTITLDKAQDTDLTVTLSNNQVIVIPKGETEVVENVETSRIDDAYKQGTTNETVSIKSTSNPEIVIENKTATITVKDDTDPIDVTITATVTTPKIIDVNTKTDGTTGVKVTGYNSDGKETDLSIIKGTNHDGFGVEGKNLSNGDTKELGLEEKIVVEFTDGKDVNSLDVSFAWRNNHETAKLTFVKDGQVVGYATVDGDGKSTTKAIVKYYDENNNLIKEVNAKGSSDKVDEAFTFELPDLNGGIVSFDKVEFSAPSNKDDYLINKIVYKEVIDPTVTNIETDGGNVTFNIQIDENYPPQGKATAVVEINNIKYDVVLNATGRGILTLDSSKLGTDLSNVEVKVLEVKGGNYEKVNSVKEDFDFTPTVNTPTSTNDTISTDEDVSYTLKVTDFGEVSSSTKEFKITKLPENGKLYLTITKDEVIIDKEGNQTVATEDMKIEITKDQTITLGQIASGSVEFVPNANSDEDGSFKFQVGDGKGNFSEEYTTTIDVKAVADAPTVSINVENGNPITQNNTVTIKTPVDTPMKEVALTVTDKDARNANNIKGVINDTNIYEAQNGNNHTNGHLAFKNVNSNSFNIENDLQKPIIIFGNQNNSTFDVNGTIKFVGGLNAESISSAAIIINNTIDTIKVSKNSDGTFSGEIGNTIITNVKAIAYEGGVIGELSSFNSNSFEIDYDAIKNQNLVQENGQYFKVTTETTTEIVGYKYEIEYSAKLTDTDESETLSVVIKNVPEGAKLYDSKGTEISSTNGEYKVKVPEDAKDISDSLTMKVPESYKGEINLQIEAKATETRDNEDGLNFKTSEDIVLDFELASIKEPESLSSDLLSSNSELKLSDMVGDESDKIDLSNIVSYQPKEESSSETPKNEPQGESPFDVINNNQQHQELASSVIIPVDHDTI